MNKGISLSVAALVVATALQAAAANEVGQQLSEVKVTAEQSKSSGEITKTRRAIQDELITDTRDLVRYTTDVGISDSGRHNKGFAIRGVEGNRVGINIDGVALPDSEENSLYARYGNFNSSRILIDPELTTGIDIMRGADAFNTGSGSLGGGVSYRTLHANDIVQNGNKFGALLKNGYASKNREWTYTAGLGYVGEQLEAVLLYSQRRGHELQSLGRGEDTWGSSRGIPDPSKHRNHNYLAKLAYLFNTNHKLSMAYSGQKHDNYTDEKSYNLFGSSWRYTHDLTTRHNLNVAYEYFPTNSLLGYAKLDYDYQKTDLGAINYKGSRPGDLDDIHDRRMQTTFHRLNARVDSSLLESRFGNHQLSLRTAYSEKRFKNINHDTGLWGERDQYTDVYTIQVPVKTSQFTLSLQDKVEWNEKWSSNLGVRYDLTTLKPQKANAACRYCFAVSPHKTTFQTLSGNIGLDYQFTPTWKIGYQLSNGYRLPSASEMYFTFLNPAGNWLANPTLKPERSLNHSISLQANNEKGHLNLQVYQTKYQDFLFQQETRAWRRFECDAHCQQYLGNRVYTETLFQRMINIDNAKIQGIEVSGKLNLDQVITPINQGWSVMGALGYSKGRLYGTNESLLSIQPMKVILGFGYDDPQDRFGIQARWTYLAAKKAKEAQILAAYYDREGRLRDFPFLNNSASLVDVFGFAKIGKNITLRGGIYNLFNRKYHTWDALRGISVQPGTTNTVDKELKGLERFYAPGRNFALSVEVKF